MSEKLPPFITFHGIDGTGKTDSASATYRILEARGIKAVNYDEYEKLRVKNPFSSVKRQIEEETPAAARLAFYLASTIFHSVQITQLVKGGFTVVKSRYLDDVIAHHAHLGVPNGEAIARLLPIVQPDLKVILTATEWIRQQRLENRGRSDLKDEEVRYPGSRLDFFENYLVDHAHHLISIGHALKLDVSEISPQDVGQRVIENLIDRELLPSL